MKNINKDFTLKLIKQNPEGSKGLYGAKRKLAKEFKTGVISNALILETYHNLVKSKKIPRNINFEELLRTKKVRTMSGIAPLALFTKPYKCPGRCIYCPDQPNMPKSYLDDEPAIMRAVLCDYDPIKQIQARIKSLEVNGHKTDKIELIVMGGTFNALPRSYQKQFITKCYYACNTYNKKKRGINTLEKEQKKNENTKHRIIGLTLETRPDYINKKEIKWMRKLGATRIEMGVQSIYDDILDFNRRGHKVRETINATKLLKNAGFKINYHIMPNLPKSNPKKDLKMFHDLFTSENFQPDMLKIYPCVLTRHSELYKLWKNKKYVPYSDKLLIGLLIEIKKIIPPYARIMRLGRDIPAPNIIAGNKISNIRQEIEKLKAKQNIKCLCIRCREIKNKKYNPENIKLKRISYKASGGIEIFLSFEDVKQDKLLAFLRLRIPSQCLENKNNFIPALDKASIIREIHTYGKLIPLNKKGGVQHFGFGKKLVKEAENISKKEYNIDKIAVISGIGVRNYYRKLGYRLKNTYMVKNI